MNMDMCIRFHEKGIFLTRRTSEEKKEEAEAIKNWNPRYRKNVIIYGFMVFWAQLLVLLMMLHFLTIRLLRHT